MKSRRHHRSRWAHVNSPEGLRRRRARADARREAESALLPPVYEPPEPMTVWRTIVVLDADGHELHRITLRVPYAGRCDQHAAEVDGVREMLSATEVGRRVAGMVPKRASVEMQADMRREGL